MKSNVYVSKIKAIAKNSFTSKKLKNEKALKKAFIVKDNALLVDKGVMVAKIKYDMQQRDKKNSPNKKRRHLEVHT